MPISRMTYSRPTSGLLNDTNMDTESPTQKGILKHRDWAQNITSLLAYPKTRKYTTRYRQVTSERHTHALGVSNFFSTIPLLKIKEFKSIRKHTRIPRLTPLGTERGLRKPTTMLNKLLEVSMNH